MIRLGVNIDHVATVRQARKTNEPDPVWAAALAELGGADGITIHLREDRRHIQERDLRILKQTCTVPLNLEMAVEESIVDIAIDVKPDFVCLVPEKREELTTEGGLDVVSNADRISNVIRRCHETGIKVSLFIDPDESQIRKSAELNSDAVELHTGCYAEEAGESQQRELDRIVEASSLVCDLKMGLHAGHGLTYRNVKPIAEIEGMQELNIGHSIIARSLMVGLKEAVSEMKELMVRAQQDSIKRFGSTSF